MAQRRMFSLDIVGSEEFLEMPHSSQSLYFQLAMRADDDGFIQPKNIMRLTCANADDLKVLMCKRFLLPFESGVVVIKHWLIHNMIRKDRHTPTRFINEKSTLFLKDNNAYTDNEHKGSPLCIRDDNQMTTKCQPSDNQMSAQVRLGKVRLGKDRLGKDRLGESIAQNANNETKPHRFIPPTIEEVRAYCKERQNNVEPSRFVDHYEAKGWMIGKNKMKDWKACVRTWERQCFTGDRQQKKKSVFEINQEKMATGDY